MRDDSGRAARVDVALLVGHELVHQSPQLLKAHLPMGGSDALLHALSLPHNLLPSLQSAAQMPRVAGALEVRNEARHFDFAPGVFDAAG